MTVIQFVTLLKILVVLILIGFVIIDVSIILSFSDWIKERKKKAERRNNENRND